ncbi:MAG: aminoacyl-tRNA hydrolase [Phycisphaerae bacterium]|nr:aminoacyl-tRNA hydrolase [Phycisphaerae bacterium]
MRITPKISIPDDELHVSFVRSSGPGGQNVNKVATACQLRFNIATTESLPAGVKERLVRQGGRKVTGDGVLIIDARRYRTQQRNHFDALERLKTMIAKAAVAPKKRRPTKPTKASKQRRLDSKQRRGKIKKLRGGVGEE